MGGFCQGSIGRLWMASDDDRTTVLLVVHVLFFYSFFFFLDLSLSHISFLVSLNILTCIQAGGGTLCFDLLPSKVWGQRKINLVFVPKMFWWFNTLDWWGSCACACQDKCGLFLLVGPWKQTVRMRQRFVKDRCCNLLRAVKKIQGFRAQHNSTHTSAVCQKEWSKS